jgi:hypothetical protein
MIVLPIGSPISNTQIYILDAYLNTVPVGVAGELHIAGDGLARGYLNRADLTAEKFIPNPFGVAGARMYKTGDLARYLPDGNIEYLGRLDHQVKIRGFRIELGEIEAALSALPAVREAIVLAREDHAGDKRLVAYLTAKQGCATPSTAELRTTLLTSLPEYMVPAHYVVLEALPLTPNGKIDRKALPAPNMETAQIEYVAPTTETESILCKLWEEVLGIEKVGVADNFLSLGGHSLSALKVFSKVQVIFDLDIPIKIAFLNTTVASIATYIDALVLNRANLHDDIENEIEEGEF